MVLPSWRVLAAGQSNTQPVCDCRLVRMTSFPARLVGNSVCVCGNFGVTVGVQSSAAGIP